MTKHLDPERAFYRHAMAQELLDAETEADLARAWRDRRDEAALHRLITAYGRLALSIAQRYRRYQLPLEDIVQQAHLGLMRAADKFDPERGVRFSTYSAWWIKAAIQDYVMRNWSIVRGGATAAQKSLFFNLRRIHAEVERRAQARGAVMTGEEIAEEIAGTLGVPLEQVRGMLGRVAGADLSLNATQRTEDGSREWQDLLEDDAPQAEEIVIEAAHRRRVTGALQAALRDLPARERHIVIERRLREEPRTLTDLGIELGVSKERVRQLEERALGRLRTAMAGLAEAGA
ncbi:MAG: RNA polymerase factor sigma-32 [Alphaproteobacteria bacterium HGW-Alphaproteobacteria-2]|nr:MAG: RNA polymerase factor sigma-32 [Alphaproteobacteria bacterium HGW-Alphaproteobacteria-2]